MRMTRMLAGTVAATTTMIVMAAAARAEVLQHINTKGSSALTSFDQVVPITCADGTTGTIETFVGITAIASAARSQQLPDLDTDSVFVAASRSDSCNNIHDHFVFDGPDGAVTVIEHSIGMSRSATVSGSVVLDGNQLIGSVSDSALQKVRTGSIEIQR